MSCERSRSLATLKNDLFPSLDVSVLQDILDQCDNDLEQAAAAAAALVDDINGNDIGHPPQHPAPRPPLTVVQQEEDAASDASTQRAQTSPREGDPQQSPHVFNFLTTLFSTEPPATTQPKVVPLPALPPTMDTSAWLPIPEPPLSRVDFAMQSAAQIDEWQQLHFDEDEDEDPFPDTTVHLRTQTAAVH